MKDKILVVWYSRTGVTAQVAGDIVAELQCEGEEIVDLKKRVGGFGFFKSCIHAALRKGTKIKPPAHNPGDFRLVVICSPVWAGSMACAVRQWMKDNAGNLHEVAFLLTAGGGKVEGAFKSMAKLAGRETAAELALRDKAVKAGECADLITEFAVKLRVLVAEEA